jgi:hypothetical protein
VLGHSRFDQPFPNAINKAKWIELAIGEKREDGIEEKVSENSIFFLVVHLTIYYRTIYNYSE